MSAAQCDSLTELASNTEYHCLIILKIALGVGGTCGICYQWSVQGVRFLVHDNTKAVFNIFFALNVLVSAGFALFYLFELIRLRFECFVVNFRVILLTKGMVISAITAANHVVMIISFERLYSAIFPAHFEKNSSKKLALFVAGTVQLMTVSSASYAFSLFMLSSDLYLNFIRKPATHAENRRVILVILPIEITQSLLCLATTSALLLQTKFIDTSNSMNRIVYLELATSPAALFPILFAAIIELRVARRVQTSVIDADQNVDYFEGLRRAWNA